MSKKINKGSMNIHNKPWRLSSYRAGGRQRKDVESKDFHFDELVVGKWLHIEQMAEDHYWMSIGENSSFDIRRMGNGDYEIISQKTGKIVE